MAGEEEDAVVALPRQILLLDVLEAEPLKDTEGTDLLLTNRETFVQPVEHLKDSK